MEKKTTHRIIGVLVVLGLIVVLLPLLFGGNNNTPTQTATIKAPPFKDSDTSDVQPATVAQNNTNPSNPTPDTTHTQSAAPTGQLADSQNLQIPGQADTNTPAPANNDPLQPFLQADNSAMQAPGSTMPNTAGENNYPGTPATPSAGTSDQNQMMQPGGASPYGTGPSAQAPQAPIPNNSNAQANPNAVMPVNPAPGEHLPGMPNPNHPDFNPALNAPGAPAAPNANQSSTNATPSPIKHVQANHSAKRHHQIHQAMNHDSFAKGVWAIQMGSFKNKDNAKRLASALRAHGYKAFTREVNSAMRVYVGPELRQAQAASIADKIQQDMNMHGIVVTFHNLEL